MYVQTAWKKKNTAYWFHNFNALFFHFKCVIHNVGSYTEYYTRDWTFILFLNQASVYPLSSDSGGKTAFLLLYSSNRSIPSLLQPPALLTSPYLPIRHQYSTLNSRGPIHSWQIRFAQPEQPFVWFKAKLLLWKCETNTICPLAFFLHTSTSYEPNKAHPSSALTMDWGERSGARVWAKSTARGQKACW